MSCIIIIQTILPIMVSSDYYLCLLIFHVFQLQKPVGKVVVQIARIFKTEATQPPLMQLHHASSTLINVHPAYAN